jgi:hypothetical protein
MAEVLKLDFDAALARLQVLLGKKVCALINVSGTFSGCTVEGTLLRVVSLAPDQAAIQIVIGDGQNIILDPVDVSVHLLLDEDDEEAGLEFRLAHGSVTIKLGVA